MAGQTFEETSGIPRVILTRYGEGADRTGSTSITFDATKPYEDVTINNEKVRADRNNMHIKSYNVVIARTPTDNSAPNSEETRRPDTGFSGTRYVIHAWCRGWYLVPGGTGNARTIMEPADFATLVSWYRQKSRVRGAYRNNRFGIETQYAPSLNMAPDPTSSITRNRLGLKMISLEIFEDVMYNVKRLVITLEQSGKDPRAEE